MKKKRRSMSVRTLLLLVCILSVLLGAAGSGSQAYALSVLNEGGQTVIYDGQTQTYWYQDLTAFADQTYYEQSDTIEGLNQSSYFGVNTWNFASKALWDQMFACWGSDWISLFVPTGGFEGDMAWQGRLADPHLIINDIIFNHWGALVTADEDNVMTMQYCWPSVGYDNPTLGAWVVADAPPDIAAVPEPATGLLVGFGLLGMLALVRRRRGA